jgi:hypothetical protein
VAYAEVYAVNCLGLKDGFSRTYEFTTTPLPGQTTDQRTLIEDAKDNLSTEGLAKPPYTDVTFKVRLIRSGEI